MILEKSVKIERYQLRMGLEIEEKHPEIVIWLEVISEAKKADKEVINYFQDKIFFESKKPIQFIKNILNELLINGFVDKNYNITEKGQNTLKNGIVYMPHLDIFEVLVINDPLFPQIIFAFDKLKPSLYLEIQKRFEKSKNKSSNEKFTELPRFIFNSISFNSISTLTGKVMKSIIISKIEERGIKLETTKSANMKLIIDDEFNVSLNINYKNESYKLDRPIFDENLVIEEILKNISTKADMNLYRIPVNYVETKSIEIKTFQKDFILDEIKLQNIGFFDKIKILNLGIYPDNITSAESWTKELLLDAISTYITNKELKTKWKKVTDELAFNNYQLTIPTKKSLLENLVFGSEKYWFLIAPEDLQMEKVIIK